MDPTLTSSEKPKSELVSIIIPVHNRSNYLYSCLTSIAQQTYSKIEVIVVDDASTENLQSVIDSIEWPSTFLVRYIRLNENRGQGYAREIGRQIATGSYINYQDSDDLFHPEKIAAQLKTLQNHPEAGMCYCITLNFYTFPFDGTERLRGSHYIESILPGVLEKRPWATGSCLWTREATDIIGPWFDGRREEDFLYEVRAGCKDIKIAYTPQILMFVRCHTDEQEFRAPSKKVYQQAITAYHEVLNDLDTAGKLRDPRILLAITREIFRVCAKLFDFNDTETPIKILLHLSSVCRSPSKIQNLYCFIAKFVLLSRYMLPRRYKASMFKRLCKLALHF